MATDHAHGNSCCGDSESVCVFAKALLAHAAHCSLVQRRALAERELLECTSPVARINCAMLAALMHERSRFALKLPPAGRPLLHAQALRLQCGGLGALGELLPDGDGDVHRMVQLAQERHGSLTELPWQPLVQAVAAWRTPQRRRQPR